MRVKKLILIVLLGVSTISAASALSETTPSKTV